MFKHVREIPTESHFILYYSILSNETFENARLNFQHSISHKCQRFFLNVNDFELVLFGLGGVEVRRSCRSREMLQNEHLLAKIGVDCADNELLKLGGVIELNVIQYNSIFIGLLMHNADSQSAS